MFKRKCLAFFALACVACAPFATLAYAQATAVAPVVVPWGDWSVTLLNGASTLFAGLLTWFVSRYMPPLVKSFLSEKALDGAVNYALGAIEGAVRGQTLTLPATSAVLTSAESYLVANAPAIASHLCAMIRPAILAKMSALGVVPAEASAASTGASVPGVS